MNWEMARRSGTTIAIYMPGQDYGRLRASLLEAGIDGDTPCVIVSCASRPSQQMRRSRVDRLRDTEPLPAPSLLIVGRVASCASKRARPSLASTRVTDALAMESPAVPAPHPQG